MELANCFVHEPVQVENVEGGRVPGDEWGHVLHSAHSPVEGPLMAECVEVSETSLEAEQVEHFSFEVDRLSQPGQPLECKLVISAEDGESLQPMDFALLLDRVVLLPPDQVKTGQVRATTRLHELHASRKRQF